jgi:uncharacterized protein YoxC
MKKKATLQDILSAINTFSVTVDGKFEAINKRFDAMDKRFDGIEKRLDRVESTVYAIQKDVEGIQDEMRGIHKVLDRFDWRITRLEKHLGLEIKGSAG